MGNLEKLVVLVVLFLSAVVLAVSLSDDEVMSGESPLVATSEPAVAEADPGAVQEAGMGSARTAPRAEPRSDSRRVEGAGSSLPATIPSKPAVQARTESANLLLDAGAGAPRAREAVEKKAPEIVSPATPGNGLHRILKSTVGLSSSMSDLYREYKVRDGDTWTGLAQRFYKDTRRVSDLQVANEDLSGLAAGQSILVPVYDLSREARSRPRLVAVERPTTGRVRAPNAGAGTTTAVTSVKPGTTYTVVDGDNLSKISSKVYGTAHRWKVIFDANRDTMKSADWLQVGMRLRIPTLDEAAAHAAPGPVSTERVTPDGPHID